MLIPELLFVYVSIAHIVSGEKRTEPVCTSGEANEVQHSIGLLNHPIEFPICPTLSQSIAEVVWYFQTQEKTLIIAKFNQNWTDYNLDFRNRLQTSDDGTKLHIQELRREDAGIYRVRVTFADHEICYKCFDLTLYAPVTITNITCSSSDLGENTLHVIFTGDHPVTVTWSKDGGDLPKGHRLSDYNKSLSIPKHATGLYRVTVTNNASTRSMTYTIPPRGPAEYLNLAVIIAIIICTFLGADLALCLLILSIRRWIPTIAPWRH